MNTDSPAQEDIKYNIEKDQKEIDRITKDIEEMKKCLSGAEVLLERAKASKKFWESFLKKEVQK